MTHPQRLIVFSLVLALVACNDSGTGSNSEDASSASSSAETGTLSSAPDAGSSSSALSDASSSSDEVNCTNTYTDSTVTDCRDGQTYRFVTIGTQTWMAENLNYDAQDSVGCRCYEDSATYCDTYGRIYRWTTAMGLLSNYVIVDYVDTADHQGVCPIGWHVPNEPEWEILVDYLGGSSNAGTSLKATTGWNEDGNGNDQYGFSALPGGYRIEATFKGIGEVGYWWAASEQSMMYGFAHSLLFDKTYLQTFGQYMLYGAYIRCVRNL